MGGTPPLSQVLGHCAPVSPAGEGRLEVCGHGHRQDIPLVVYPRLLPGDRRTLSPSVPSWNDLMPHRLLWPRRGIADRL